ncbi:MAG TPA: DNA-primase RepB domain-containing protein [Edaphobacter sp.]|nr:DNA-primase RepB domain-containing protein [Edaphobacter sp.]
MKAVGEDFSDRGIPDMQPKQGDWEAYSDLAHRTVMGNVATQGIIHERRPGGFRLLARPTSARKAGRKSGLTYAVVETSAGNFQIWLKHPRIFPKFLGTFAAQKLAERYDADPSAAEWRRFGQLPGFTNCKPKYRKSDGRFPFVRLHSHAKDATLRKFVLPFCQS